MAVCRVVLGLSRTSWRRLVIGTFGRARLRIRVREWLSFLWAVVRVLVSYMVRMREWTRLVPARLRCGGRIRFDITRRDCVKQHELRVPLSV